jgi:ribosomal protein S18 acetylase RimI-like enzyme
VGKKLMEVTHEYGKKHGCALATVTTMDFQAPDFYQKLGYKIDFSRGGYSKGASCIFMAKKL